MRKRKTGKGREREGRVRAVGQWREKEVAQRRKRGEREDGQI